MDHILNPERRILSLAEPVNVLGQLIQTGRSRNFALFFQQVRSHPAPVLLFLLNDLFRVQRFNIDCYRQILNIVSQQAVAGERRQVAFRKIMQCEDIVEIAVRVKTRGAWIAGSFGILAEINLRQIGFELIFVVDIKLKCRFIDRPVILPEQRDMIQGDYRQI